MLVIISHSILINTCKHANIDHTQLQIDQIVYMRPAAKGWAPVMRVPKVSLRDASPEAFAAAARGGCFVLTDHDVPIRTRLRGPMLATSDSRVVGGVFFSWLYI